MGTYKLDKTPELTEYIKKSFFEIPKSMTGTEIIELMEDLRKQDLIKYQPDFWETRQGLNNAPQEPLTFKIFNRSSYFENSITMLLSVLNELGVTTFDFNDIYQKVEHDGKYPAINFKFILSEYKQTANFKGNFVLSCPIEQKKQKFVRHIRIDGKFYLNNRRGNPIELPEFMVLPPFEESRWNTEQKWESVEDYRNRPERLEKLKRIQNTRSLVKKSKESGVLSFRDSFGLPLEVGCSVVFCGYGCKLGTIVGQTSKQIKVKDILTGYTQSVNSFELMRLR